MKEAATAILLGTSDAIANLFIRLQPIAADFYISNAYRQIP